MLVVLAVSLVLLLVVCIVRVASLVLVCVGVTGRAVTGVYVMMECVIPAPTPSQIDLYDSTSGCKDETVCTTGTGVRQGFITGGISIFELRLHGMPA